MKSLKKLSVPIILAVVILATISGWRAHRTKVATQKLKDDFAATLTHAQQGDASSEEHLGGLYFYGNGVTQDYAQAIFWLRKAGEQGNVNAQYAVGYLYDTGKGVSQDFNQAFHWYQLAADKENPQAECGLAAMYYGGRGVSQDRAKAAYWYRRSAEHGLARAQYDLGYMYYHGEGVAKDRSAAIGLIRKAAEQGDDHAMQFLGMKLTPWLICILAIQATAGFALAFRPLSLNLWEPNEGMRGISDWLSIATGILFLFAAGLSLYGYTHNLIWRWIYGVTGFELVKWSLNLIGLALLTLILFGKKTDSTDVSKEESDPTCRKPETDS